jgi:hypothetical protein
VLWITEWPRSQVYPGFLAPLVLSNGILRTLALHYTPVRADQAARDLRKKKTELISDAAQRRKIGQIDDAASSAELDDVLQQEADLTAGHGVLRVSGLVVRLRADRGRARRRGGRGRAGRDPSVLRDPPPRRPASPGLHRSPRCRCAGRSDPAHLPTNRHDLPL